MDDAPFMLGNRTEGTAAETAAHDVDRVLDHFKGGHVGVAVFFMRYAGVGQVKHAIHFLGGQRNRGRVDPYLPCAVQLNQRARIAGVGFAMHDSRGVGVQYRVVFYCFIGWQANNGL